MSVIYPIAVITFKEGIRNRSIYGISLLALALFGFNLVIANMTPRDVGKVAVDMALSTVSFAGLLLVLFVGINLMAKDLDKRTIYMVLSRPLSRAQYILGKFLGMCLLIIVTVAFLSVLALLSILMLKLGYPDYFERFSWSLVALAMLLIIAMLIVLSALSFLFASFSSTSFITLVLTMIAYIIGQSLTDVKALVESPQAAGLGVSPLTVNLVQAAYYIFPNLSFFDIKTQAAHGIAVSPVYLALVLLYGAVYSGLTVALASLIFRKKEFP